MAESNDIAREAQGPPRAELVAILGRFSDARCVLECAVRSLEAWHGAESGAHDEAVCLRHGLELIARIYNQVDSLILAMPKTNRD